MRAMESPDAEVHDPDADRANVICRPGAVGGQSVKSLEGQTDHCVESSFAGATSWGGLTK